MTEENKALPVVLGFVQGGTRRIDLAEGTWIEVKKDIPFEEYMEAFAGVGKKADLKPGKTLLEILQKVIVAWSDETMECTPANIATLNANVIIALGDIVLEPFMPDKKKLPSSKQT